MPENEIDISLVLCPTGVHNASCICDVAELT